MRISDLIRQLQGFQYTHGNRDMYIYSLRWDGYIGLDRLILSPENGKNCFVDVVHSGTETIIDLYDEDISKEYYDQVEEDYYD